MHHSPATIRYVAFLRAINVGGRTVKMDELRGIFEQLEITNVATFIASGNVIFDSPEQDARKLEDQIEQHLRATLSYDVASFLRSTSELAAIAAYEPFPKAKLDAVGTTLYISFLHDAPATEAIEKLMALETETDRFHVHQRELYWLISGRISDSRISGALLERVIGGPATMRNRNTIDRLVARYPTNQ
jgi:uncharacterized protein (DUF1697 family)